jgi:hypothetical protein
MTQRVLALFLIIVADTIYLTNPVLSQAPAKLNLNWGQAIRGSRTSVSMEVCVEPSVRRGNPIHDRVFQLLPQLGGGVYAYLYGRLAELGIDVVDEAEFIDYPGQCSGATPKDRATGKPNGRYWVLRWLLENFAPGDKVVESRFISLEPGDESSQGDDVSPGLLSLAMGGGSFFG